MKTELLLRNIKEKFDKKKECQTTRKPLSYEEVIKRYEELSTR